MPLHPGAIVCSSVRQLDDARRRIPEQAKTRRCTPDAHAAAGQFSLLHSSFRDDSTDVGSGSFATKITHFGSQITTGSV
jgi:hypothetical protein